MPESLGALSGYTLVLWMSSYELCIWVMKYELWSMNLNYSLSVTFHQAYLLWQRHLTLFFPREICSQKCLKALVKMTMVVSHECNLLILSLNKIKEKKKPIDSFKYNRVKNFPDRTFGKRITINYKIRNNSKIYNSKYAKSVIFY